MRMMPSNCSGAICIKADREHQSHPVQSWSYIPCHAINPSTRPARRSRWRIMQSQPSRTRIMCNGNPNRRCTFNTQDWPHPAWRASVPAARQPCRIHPTRIAKTPSRHSRSGQRSTAKSASRVRSIRSSRRLRRKLRGKRGAQSGKKKGRQKMLYSSRVSKKFGLSVKLPQFSF